MGYQPALDGVRAVSIAAVLAFHLGAGWMPGGYLGVSVFFTLSGYLITTLLLTEREATGRIDLRAFYVRRVRRLLPAALTCLGGIAALDSLGAFPGRDLGPELVAALGQVANWEALVRERPYAELFMAPSPIAHFWSLAIEEQFYWVWPLAMAALTAWVARGSRRSTAAPLIVGFGLFAASAPLTARWLGSEAVYLASWTRFAEILAGAALAAVIAGRTVPSAARRLALPCLLAILGLCVVTPTVGGWPHAGALPLFALLTVGLIVGIQVEGPVTRVLSLRPLVWVGRISYGLYLYHWPVVVVLDEVRTGLDGPRLLVLRLGVTVAVSVASHALIERPIRFGTPVRPAIRLALAGTACTLVAVGLALRAGPVADTSTETVEVASRGSARTPADSATPTGGTAAELVLPAPPPPVVVALLGDSVLAWLLRDAPAEDRHPGVVVVDGAYEACDGAVDRPPVRDKRHRVLPVAPGCEPWTVSYPAALGDPALPVDVAVVSIGGGAFLDHELPSGWTGPCEDMQWYVDDAEARLRYAKRHAGHAVVLLPSWLGERATFLLPDDHPERATCVREQITAVAERAGAPIIDLAEILCPEGPAGDCSIFRQLDGVHVDPDHASDLLAWLLEKALKVAGPATQQP